jgi:hypothetical protein
VYTFQNVNISEGSKVRIFYRLGKRKSVSVIPDLIIR